MARKALKTSPTRLPHSTLRSTVIHASIFILTVPFQSCFGHSPTNAAHSLSQVKAGTHSASLKKSHTRAHTPKQGPSLLCNRAGHLTVPHQAKEQPEEADARLMACVRFLRRRGPAGLRNLFPLLLKLHFCAPHPGLSTLARCGGVTTALGMLGALPKCSVRRFQNGLHLCPHSGVGNIPTFPQRIAHNVSHAEGGSFSSEATVASDLPSDFYKYVNYINNSACRFCCNCFCCMVR